MTSLAWDLNSRPTPKPMVTLEGFLFPIHHFILFKKPSPRGEYRLNTKWRKMRIWGEWSIWQFNFPLSSIHSLEAFVYC